MKWFQKRLLEYNAASNNSMDVRAKQRLSYLACLFNSNGLGGGFAPRHLSRSTLFFEMMTIPFPTYFDAPLKLLQTESNCGLVTAWAILKHFKKRTSSAKLIELSRHTKKHGTFAISLAVALRRHCLKVSFFSETDPNPNAIEKHCFRVAEEIEVDVQPAISLDLLLSKVSPRSVVVVLYNTPEDNGHLTPLLGVDGNNLILPFSDEGFMSKQEFLVRWSEPEIYRQSLAVSL